MAAGGLHAVVDAWAAARPDAPGAEDAGAAWSYAELRDASLRAAALLRSRGVGEAASAATPRPLALALPRGREWYALCIAAWRLALPVLALSEDMPDKAAERDRAERGAGQTRPRAAVLAEPGPGLPGAPEDCVVWRAPDFWREARLLPARLAGGDAPADPQRPLVYCYTGGTTKHSKCVVVSHAMALWEMEHYAAATRHTITASDRVLCYTSAYWGAACFGQVDIALAFGCCCVFVPAERGVDFIAQAVRSCRISVLGTVPSQLRGAYPGGPGSKPECLRVILTWGEKLPVKLSAPWRSCCAIFELLIASEYWLALHSDCSTWRDPADGQEKHVYEALPGLDMLVLTDDGRDVARGGAVGEVGEFYLAGPTVFPGYLGADGRIGEDAESRAAFVLREGRAYYRSRDRLRRAPNGGFVYCGRADALAKLGGAWVDLEALEATVAAVPGVATAALLAADGEEGGVDVFVALEPPGASWGAPACRVLDAVRRSAGAGCRVHARSDLPLHPATAKVDRRRLRSELEAAQAREVEHELRLAGLHRGMLLGYAAWYVPLLACLAAGAVAMPRQLGGGFEALVARLCLLPYLWAAALYTPSITGIDWSSRPLGLPDVVLLVAALLPSDCIPCTWLAACAMLSWQRDRDGRTTACFAALGVALLVLAVRLPASPLRRLACCFVAAVFVAPRLFGVLAGLPACFFLVVPKWLGDDWRWRCRCEEARLRRRLARLLYWSSEQSWDWTWAWDEDRYWRSREGHFDIHLNFGMGRQGRSTSVDFRHGDIVPISVPSAAASAGPALTQQDSAIAALVERAGGDPRALAALDSLQAITLSELIRKELGPAVSVAAILGCSDASQLAASIAAAASQAPPCAAVDAGGAPDEDGAYRVYTMKFPRMPVDWTVRYSGPGHLDLAALQRAADRLVERHSALRTVQTPDEPIREAMDRVASLWQLWVSVLGGRVPRRALSLVGRCLFACWPRTVTRPAEHARVPLRFPPGPRARDEAWENVADDLYVHGVIKDLAWQHRWPLDIIVVPLFRGEPPPGFERAKNTAEVALSLPPESVAWYIYCGICHAYSDGASGQALMGDLLRFYYEESGGAPRLPHGPVPEQLALLQRRLRRSLWGRAPREPRDPNNDIFHEIACEDFGKREGYSTRLRILPSVISALRSVATGVLGCGADVAWLTAIMGAMFRLFPQQRRILLSLKVACRDGPGELQLVGFLSEQRLVSVDILDPETATLLDIAETIGTARRARAWRAPAPYEAGLTVFVNIVSAMVDGLPGGFRHVVKPSKPSSTWRGQAYCHLNVRIDQRSASEWDFRVFYFDAAWGWNWLGCFADALGAAIMDMALAPTAPLFSHATPVRPKRPLDAPGGGEPAGEPGGEAPAADPPAKTPAADPPAKAPRLG